MSSSSNITLRPRLKAFTRMSDDALIFVNIDFVRMMSPVAGGVRLHFGQGGNDHVDVTSVTMQQLMEQMDP